MNDEVIVHLAQPNGEEPIGTILANIEYSLAGIHRALDRLTYVVAFSGKDPKTALKELNEMRDEDGSVG
jgi:hypothetical protein